MANCSLSVGVLIFLKDFNKKVISILIHPALPAQEKNIYNEKKNVCNIYSNAQYSASSKIVFHVDQ